MNEVFEFTLHARKSPAFGRFFVGFHPICGRRLALWVAGRRLAAGLGSSGRWWRVEEGDTKERGGRTTEAEVARERERASRGEGFCRASREGEREGEIRGGKITVLPFPYLYRFRDRPYLNAARLIRNRFLNPSP